MVTARYLPDVGGTEIHTYEVARRLASAGYDVTVLTTNLSGNLPETEETEGFRVRRVKAWPARHDYYISPELYRVIMHGDWNIVHCQGYHTLVAPTAMLAARKKKIPYFVTFHSGGNSSRLRKFIRPIQQTVLRPLLAQAEGLISVSRWEADYFQKALQLPGEMFRVIPNGTFLPQQESRPRQKEFPLLVSVGRLERYKGHQRVIAALPLVMQECQDVRLRIVGSGAYEPALKQLASDLQIEDRVDIRAIAGSNRDEMAALLQQASLVMLLSEYESQSISAMEAIVMGCPVLVNDSTALSELVARGFARGIPPKSSTQQLAHAILDQIRHPLIPPASDLPTWEDCAEKIAAIYLESIQRRTACAF